MVTVKYCCKVQNDLYITSSVNSQIKSITGVHLTNKTNNDAMYFVANNKKVKYLPKGLEKYYTELVGLQITEGRIQKLDQSDLIMYTKLKFLRLSNNDIQILENDVFMYNPNLILIDFEQNKINFIGSTVFECLSFLTTLDLQSNFQWKLFVGKNSSFDVGIVIKTV